MTGEHEATLRRFEDRLAELDSAQYVLTLFVAGASDLSMKAINNVRSLCERHLAGRYQLEVVDVHREVVRVAYHEIVATPTLIREAPLPKRTLVGDLSDSPRVLAVLGIGIRATVQEPGIEPG
jgi:circadian clock protein KaiB